MPERQRVDGEKLPSDVTHVQNEQRRERHWRRLVRSELRDRFITAMMEQLQRITGDCNVRHVRRCASRYESFVWKKSRNHVQYVQKLEQRIESLRRQPLAVTRNDAIDVTVRLNEDQRRNSVQAGSVTLATGSSSPIASCPYHCHDMQQGGAYDGLLVDTAERRNACHSSDCRASSSVSGSNNSKRATRWKGRTPSSAHGASSTSLARRDELYFAKLRVMKTRYRDEVALVFRELCRVNTVIRTSASLRRHESNNLGDFLANLKKIIYLLEQQPDEACGMIPARKRAVEYLDVVESHIQRKVLPILHRLRHTYSTILRPIVLNYMKNNYRFNRRF
uniref:Mediator complex subunit 15 KIX domain-containing protein n=1 Tax=Hyaloperonospora arabidopsidis (strain Emoy2) TaxID=559515 RepID=M4BCW9_HYAAE